MRGGSFGREAKYHQHIGMADETIGVVAGQPFFELQHKGLPMSIHTADHSLPGPGTFNPQPVDGKTILMPSPNEVHVRGRGYSGR